MSDNKAIYETLEAVHHAFLNWESEGAAWQYGGQLCQVAAEQVSPRVVQSGDMDEIANSVFSILRRDGSLTKCLTDTLRRIVICHHARGVATTPAVETILLDVAYKAITPFYIFKYRDMCGYENIKKFLVSRLSYLKPAHPRWPEKKFGELWASERENYIDTIREIPLTHPQERLQKLSDHYADLEVLYQTAERATDKERYHKCMMRTLAGIELMTRAPVHHSLSVQLTPESRSPALPTPETDTMIEVEAQVEKVDGGG